MTLIDHNEKKKNVSPKIQRTRENIWNEKGERLLYNTQPLKEKE